VTIIIDIKIFDERGDYMKALMWVGAIISILLGSICIISTVVEVCVGKYSMGHPQFWGAVALHAVLGIFGIYLLTRVVPYKPKTETAGAGESDSIEGKLEKMFGDDAGGEGDALKAIGDAIGEAMGEEDKSKKQGGEEQ